MHSPAGQADAPPTRPERDRSSRVLLQHRENRRESFLDLNPCRYSVQGNFRLITESGYTKNIAKADRPKSAIAILPPRPFRGSGKAAQTAFKPARTDGKSVIHIVNHALNDLGIPQI